MSEVVGPGETSASAILLRSWGTCRALAGVPAILAIAFAATNQTLASVALAVALSGLAVAVESARLELVDGMLRRRRVLGWQVPLDVREVNHVRLQREVRYWRDLPHLVLRLATPTQQEYISLRWWRHNRELLARLRIALSAPGATSVSRRTWAIDIDKASEDRLDVI